jgi:hypothetical protein
MLVTRMTVSLMVGVQIQNDLEATNQAARRTGAGRYTRTMRSPRLRFSIRTLLVAYAALAALLAVSIRFGPHIAWRTFHSDMASGVVRIPSKPLAAAPTSGVKNGNGSCIGGIGLAHPSDQPMSPLSAFGNCTRTKRRPTRELNSR